MAEDRKAFDRDLNPNPDLDFRILIGKLGFLSENIELQQFFDLIISRLDVYNKEEINTLLVNYLAKNNLTAYTPTEPYHPATKKYIDDGGQIVSWQNATAGSNITNFYCKVSQVGKFVTITCEYKSTSNSVAGKTIATLPAVIDTASVDISFSASSYEAQDSEGQQLYIPAGGRNIKLKYNGDDGYIYSFCVTYPVI